LWQLLYAGTRMKPVSPELAGATLTIDLAALRSNYKLLARRAHGAECAAAIKGEAYGLGLEPVAKSLWAAGCRTFFVARPSEGEDLRRILPAAIIYVLDGLYPNASAYYVKHRLRPALASFEQARIWARDGKGEACAIHVDTGINRQGLSHDQLTMLAADAKLNYKLNAVTLMSHLACADDHRHKMNRQQLQRFTAARALYPHLQASLANSSGIFLGKDYHCDQVRPGIALYGGNPTPHKKNPMKPVATLRARAIQFRELKKGETVGYSASWTAPRDSRIALLAAGYRDGIPRKLSSSRDNGPAQVWFAGKRRAIIGRVSMDMMAIDITKLNRSRIKPGDQAEIIGKNIEVDEAAGWAGTISYELLTHLGNRYARLYKNPAS
jgi:alanine racemase